MGELVFQRPAAIGGQLEVAPAELFGAGPGLARLRFLGFQGFQPLQKAGLLEALQRNIERSRAESHAAIGTLFDCELDTVTVTRLFNEAQQNLGLDGSREPTRARRCFG